MPGFLNCTSPEIERHLAAMAELLLGDGSVFSDALRIEQRGNDLSMLSAPEASPGLLLKLSVSCLVPMEDFELRAQADDIVIGRTAANVTPLRSALLEHQLAVFNLTGKLAVHRAINPAFHYDEAHALLRHVYRARTQKLEFARELQAMAPGPRELSAFLYTRTLQIKLPDRPQPSRVLMPYIDYANHHPLAPSLVPLAKDGRNEALGIVNSRMVKGSDEVFYSDSQLSDALDIYLNYHFVVPDDATPFVRSLPVTVELGEHGTLSIDAGRPVSHTGELAAQDQDLKNVLPATEFTGPGRLLASYLMIDCAGPAPQTRRVLAWLIRRLAGGLDDKAIEPLVREAERQILAANRDFYATMQTLSRERQQSAGPDDPVARDCGMLAAVQLDKLARY